MLYKEVILIAIVFITDCYCDKHCKMRNLDRNMKPLTKMFRDKNAKWPENDDQKVDHCKSKFEHLHAAREYVKRCLHGLSSSLLRFTIEGIDRMFVKFSCKSSEEIKRFLKRGKCGNKGKADTAQCWSNWVNNVTMIKAINDTNTKVSLLCCSKNEWRKCNLDVYRKIGAPICSRRSIDGFQEFITKSTIDPLNIVFHCVDQKSSDCEKFKQKLPKNMKVKRSRYSTPFPAILEISNSIH